MAAWLRGVWVLGAVSLTWMVVGEAIAGDWMASTAAMAGLAVLIPFWLRAEREAAVRGAAGGDDG